MTRKSERELERDVAALEGTETFSLSDYFWADLVVYHGGDLTAGQRRLLETPEAHLPQRDVERLGEPGWSE